MSAAPDWLGVHRGTAPLLISLPHTGTDFPEDLLARHVSPWLARRDTDWWIETLYDFAASLGASVVRTSLSRSVIDVNRDPSGVSLYPGQATTELCPTTTFDGEDIYRPGAKPDEAEIARRRSAYFEPYHQALRQEVERLRASHPTVVVYDCHSIRSVIPRLFEGTLPHFNIGTNGGTTCGVTLSTAVETICRASRRDVVVNGRFKGGFISRSSGRPAEGVHAIQMELACRGYLDEPLGPVDAGNWPVPFDAGYAAPMRGTLQAVLQACLDFARARA
jgi:N-formylglutamate deformylase